MLYAVSKLSEIKGLQLAGIESDLEGLSQLAPPFIAAMDVTGGDFTTDHLVLVVDITDTDVVYESNSLRQTSTRSEFAKAFTGTALVPVTAIQNMSPEFTEIVSAEFTTGTVVRLTRDSSGSVIDITFDLVHTETRSRDDLLTEILDEAITENRANEMYIITMRRFKENAISPEVENTFKAAIAEYESKNARLGELITSLNVFLARYEDTPGTWELARDRAIEITGLISDLKSEIAIESGNALGTDIRNVQTVIGTLLDKKTEIAILFNELNRLLIASNVKDTPAENEITNQITLSEFLSIDAESEIEKLVAAILSVSDSDGDGYSDEEERIDKTNHMDYNDNIASAGTNDSDGDGYSDSLELFVGSDLYSTNVTPENYELLGYESNTRKDTDHDGAPDWIEMIVGTMYTTADSDSDNFTDYEEIRLGTNPLDGTKHPLFLLNPMLIEPYTIPVGVQDS